MFKGILDRLWALSRPRVPRLVYANGGLGDELMLTAIARKARADGAPLAILTNLPELWRDNDDPELVVTDVARWHYARMRGWLDTEIRHLPYENGRMRHIASQMAGHLGLTLPEGWRPVFNLGRPVSRDPRLIVLQNSCRGARYAADTKEWAQDRWTDLAARLSGHYSLIQLGTAADPLLPGVHDLRGRTSLKEAALVLAGASLFVGLESGLMHVAAATRTPSVIIYGGRSRPQETGYAFNENLTRSPACAGCGLNSGCPHGLACLDIPVDEVHAAIARKLGRAAA